MKYYKNIQTTIKNRNFIMLLFFSLILLFLITFKTFGLASLNANLIVFDNENKFNPTVQASESNGVDFYTKISIEIKEKENPSVIYSVDKNYDINAESNIQKVITNTKEIDSKLLEGYKLDLKLSTENINVYSKKILIDDVSHLNVFAYEKNTLHIVQYDISDNDIPINDTSRYKYKFVKFDLFDNLDSFPLNFKDEVEYNELFENKIKSKPKNCYTFDSLEANTWYIMGVTKNNNKYVLNLLYSSLLGSTNKSSVSFVPVDFEKKLETIKNRNNKNYSFEYDIVMNAIQGEGNSLENIINEFAYHLDSNGNKIDFFETNFSINYNLNGGIIKDNPTTYSTFNETFILNTPSKEGYDFVGWTGSNGTVPQTSVNIEKGSTGNKEYIANWKLKNYIIDYNLDGGTVDQTIIQPIIHNLSATYINGSDGYQGDDVSSDYQVVYSDYIQCTRPLYYQNADMYLNIALLKNFTGQINFTIPEAISGSATIISAVDSNNNSLEIKNNSIIVKSKTDDIYVNLDLTLRWTTENDRVLTVSGKADNLQLEYNIESPTISLPTPTKEGYKFIGWTGSNGVIPQTNVSIEKGNTGNKEYLANWKSLTLKVGETESDKVVATLSPDGNIAIHNSDPNDTQKYTLGNLNEKLQRQMTSEEIRAVKNITIENNMFVSTGNNLFSEYINLEKIQGLEKLDTSKMITASYMFSNCRSLINVNGVENWDVSNVRYFDNMFYFNNKLSDISALKNWNTTNASDMSSIFFYTPITDLTPLSNWNISNVKTFNSAFAMTNIKNLDALNSWNTQNTIIFSSMFKNCSELTNINGINSWNVQNGSIFDYMFANSSKITYLRGLQYWIISYSSSKVGIFDGIPDSVPKPPWY